MIISKTRTVGSLAFRMAELEVFVIPTLPSGAFIIPAVCVNSTHLVRVFA